MRHFALLAAALVLCLASGLSWAQSTEAEMKAAFAGAQVVDLRTSKVSSVVTLRDKLRIPAPSEPVLVKTFDAKSLPPALQSIFTRPGMVGVTINGRYIAIIRTELRDEYADRLRHELVHAYITLASPKPLPLWFQEGSAVHFSMGKDWKFYGQPSKTDVGVMMGQAVELPNDYKQKLQSFNFLMHSVSERQFDEWYRNAVVTGNVDTRTLLGLGPERAEPKQSHPVWVLVLVGAIVVAVLIAWYVSSKRESDYY